jgi:hypothetical protein
MRARRGGEFDQESAVTVGTPCAKQLRSAPETPRRRGLPAADRGREDRHWLAAERHLRHGLTLYQARNAGMPFTLSGTAGSTQKSKSKVQASETAVT